MKNITLMPFIALVALLQLMACASSKPAAPKKTPVIVQSPAHLPPGQAKKIYGTKSAKVFAPGQQKKHGGFYPLIVYKTPDIVILRHTDGRSFYKNHDNFIYWKGEDDRFYLDEQFISKVNYDEAEMADWKMKGGAKNIPPGQQKKLENSDNPHGHGNGKKKVKE